MAQSGDEPIVTEIYDGKGEEVKVVTTQDSEGRTVQATAEAAEDAMRNKDKTDQLGEGFGGHH